MVQMKLRPALSLFLCIVMMHTASSFRHFLVPAQPGHEVREGNCANPPPFVSIPAPKRHLGHSSASGKRLTKAVRGVEALVSLVVDLVRRVEGGNAGPDHLSDQAGDLEERRVRAHCQESVLSFSSLGSDSLRAYAEEPAAAADKCPDLKEISKKSRPSDFTVRNSGWAAMR
eukprot:763482-Hanusia_phi.AAC.6